MWQLIFFVGAVVAFFLGTLALFLLTRYLLIDSSFLHERPLEFDYRREHATALSTFLTDTNKEYNVNASMPHEVKQPLGRPRETDSEDPDRTELNVLKHRLLRPSQIYSVEVLLHIPRSTHNYDIGTFQLTGTPCSGVWYRLAPCS